MISAFEVEHEVAKAEKKRASLTASDASVGRHLSAQAFGSGHGLVAGRKGHKLRAAGNEFAGAAAGGAVGTAAGLGLTAASRGRIPPAAIGSAAGGGAAAGLIMGVNRAQNKGHFKRQKPGKKPMMPHQVSKSAFGIEHEVAKAALPSGVKFAPGHVAAVNAAKMRGGGRHVLKPAKKTVSQMLNPKGPNGPTAAAIRRSVGL